MTRLHVLMFSLSALALCGAAGATVLLLGLPEWPALGLAYLVGIALAFPLSRGLQAALATEEPPVVQPSDQPGDKPGEPPNVTGHSSDSPPSQGQEMRHRRFEFPWFVRM